MSTPEQPSAAAIWRIESAKLIASIARVVKSVDRAEEIAHDVFVEAVARWNRAGYPENVGAWLMTAARHRAFDAVRNERRDLKKRELFASEAERAMPADFDEASDDVVGDDLLRLVFVACHPVLPPEAHVALCLRLLGGLTTEEIARAFLVPEPTIAQRITRAKRTLSEKKVPFELPQSGDLSARLESVLEAIYLIFNEGYLATAGDDWLRPELCQDALRLGRVLAELMPHEAEVHGLVSLMEIQASRARARVGADGQAVLLLDQDRTQWDALHVQRGFAALERADAAVRDRPGPYFLQAPIAACHARAASAADTDWPRILVLYDALLAVAPSPIVELNRAVALGMAFGAEAGLAAVEPLVDDPALSEYPFLPSVRADFLAKLRRFEEARAEVERAAELTKNARERTLFLERARSYAEQAEPRM
ncbi:MAG: RNA polymerase sigma factor [Myxococcota bacterium]